jgi:outer membrane protein
LRLEVARAYWALVTAGSAIAVLENSLARAQALVRDATARLNAGLVPPNDVTAAGAQESRQRMLLIEARNQRALSSAALARLVGVDVQQPIEPADTLDLPAPVAASFEALVGEARGMRSERRALEQRIEAAAEQQRAAAAGMRPLVTAGGGLDYARPNPRIFPRSAKWQESWDAGVTLTWPLIDGGRSRAEAQQAGNLVTAARERLAEFDSALALELRQRLLDIESGRAAVSAAEDAMRAAAESLRVVNERYALGVVAQSEVRDADLVLLQAQLDRTRAIASVRLAEAGLARALGR